MRFRNNELEELEFDSDLEFEDEFIYEPSDREFERMMGGFDAELDDLLDRIGA